LRKIYTLREFLPFPTQLLLPRRQLLVLLLALGACLVPPLQLLGVRFAHGPGDHPGEKAAEQDDGDQHRHRVGVHQPFGGPTRSASRCFASSRSVKSIRSLSSLTSVRSCWRSPTSSARRSSSSRRASGESAAPP